jgi:hypothetical protein
MLACLRAGERGCAAGCATGACSGRAQGRKAPNARAQIFFLLSPFKLYSELKETVYVCLLKMAIQNRMIFVC